MESNRRSHDNVFLDQIRDQAGSSSKYLRKQVDRVKDFMDINYPRATVRGTDLWFVARVHNLSQNADRSTEEKGNGLTQCLTPSMIPYANFRDQHWTSEVILHKNLKWDGCLQPPSGPEKPKPILIALTGKIDPALEGTRRRQHHSKYHVLKFVTCFSLSRTQVRVGRSPIHKAQLIPSTVLLSTIGGYEFVPRPEQA
ncbi:hypothetical protein TWF506_004105 [Arthrobotrys conoides]|uniref:Uncharacterized protein n=1 Tax=Arthrobotrys conoides TaxID=74498 RepID=A0AAN8N761_9PEZI